ncbi:MAG: ABC transporter permease [Archaeoglobaceae archaeon]|nr:ABC transporter permease [Archaeoglobaceae archaeon]MCX8151898.1 ABC transporter permease [Archaeoglobaceae archaeon]MDW8013287.1 ABC transporter permease [Archaeoglobaceae archaeon]
MRGLYVIWLRDVKRFVRARSRLIGSLGMPIFFMIFFSLGFRRANIPSLESLNYIDFLIPGIVSMVVLFTGTFSGVSVVWDRQFGFLREIMVSPVSRTTIALGRIFSGATTAIFQATVMFLLGIALGFNFRIQMLPFFFLSLFLTALVFTGIGIAISTKMKDIHGFQIVVNFFVFPVFLLSGALFPISELPEILRSISKLNPLTYGVDAARWASIGFCEIDPLVDFSVLILCSVLTTFLASYLFNKTEVE